MSLLLLFGGSGAGGGGVSIPTIIDLNSRLWAFLRASGYVIDDLTAMIAIELDLTYTNDEWTARLFALIADATAAMP